MIALDILKGTDRLWHRALLHKLFNYEITGRILIIKTFQKDRFLKVVANSQFPKAQVIKAGSTFLMIYLRVYANLLWISMLIIQWYTGAPPKF